MDEQRDTTDMPELEGSASGTTRRTVMKAGLAGAAAMAFTATAFSGINSANAKSTADGKLIETMACTDGDDMTALTEGPFFKANSPQRTNLVTAGVTGVLLNLTGKVYNIHCSPIANAKLEFWQCDRNGVYDNSTYTLRGHQFTDAAGNYKLDTIIPGYYPGRTVHIHLKVQAANARVLTSQLFFPNNTQAYGLNFTNINARDSIRRRAPENTIVLGALSNNRYTGTWDFVVNTV